MTYAAHPLNFPKEERYDEWWGGKNKVGEAAYIPLREGRERSRCAWKRNLVWITGDSMHVKSVLQRSAAFCSEETVRDTVSHCLHKEFSFMVSTESGVGGSLYRCPPRSPGSKILLLSLLCFCSTYSHPGNKMQESGTSLLWVVALSFLFAYMKQSKSAP